MAPLRLFRREARELRPTISPRLQLVLVGCGALLLGTGVIIERLLHASLFRDQYDLMLTAWDSVAWFVWLLAVPSILGLVRRYSPLRGDMRRNIPRLILGSAIIYFVVVNVRFGLRLLPVLWHGQVDFPLTWQTYIMSNLAALAMDFLSFGGFFAGSFAIDYYFEHRRRVEEMLQLKLRTVQLESELAQAELSALRGQLHPHFLFNSFNAVSTLVRQHRNSEAVEMIAQLSDLLRLAMERVGKQDVALDEELDFVRRYLAIEHIRFGEKLQLQFEVEAAALSASVPNLLLQPIVENAIKHGISRRTSPGVLRVAGRRQDDRLVLTVENDGPAHPAPEPEATQRTGIGLSNTRRRLDKIYGSNYALDMSRREDGGMRVSLDLPWQTSAP